MPTQAPVPNALRQYIHLRIFPAAHDCGIHSVSINNLAENIACLIRHDQGSAIDIDLNSISIPIVEVWGKEKKIAIVVHEAPGKKKVIVEATVSTEENHMKRFEAKVAEAVCTMLEED